MSKKKLNSTELSQILKNSILNEWDSGKINRLDWKQYSISEAKTGFTN